MALSGRIDGTCTGTSGSKYNLWIEWTVTSQNVKSNRSNITIMMYLQRNDGSTSGAYNLTNNNNSKLYVMDYLRLDQNLPIDTRNKAIVELSEWTVMFYHNEDGTLSLPIYGIFTLSGVSSLTRGSVTGTAEITPIDRSAPTVTTTVTNITTDSLRLTAQASVNCDLWEYSIDNGATWISFSTNDATSASITLTRLVPNKSYSVKTRARKTYNYVLGTSPIVAVKTLGTTVINGNVNIIADDPTVNIYLNLTAADSSFTHTLKLLDGAVEVITITGITAPAGTTNKTVALTAAQRSALLSYMSAKQTLKMNLQLTTFTGTTVVGVSEVSAVVQTFAESSGPLFNGFTYADYNSITSAVTYNNQILIQGYSKLRVICYEATARNGATIKSYSAVCGNKSVSGQSIIINLDEISVSGDLTITVTVTDSRGYTSSYSQTAKILSYNKPLLQSTAIRRRNNVDSMIQLSFSGSISTVTVDGTSKNSVTAVRYRVKKTSEASYGEYVSLLPECVISGNDFSYSSLEAFSLDDKYSWDIELDVQDCITGYSTNMLITQATPVVSIRQKKIGINNPNPVSALDVIGEIKANGYFVSGYIRELNGEDFNNLTDGGMYGYFVIPAVANPCTNTPDGDTGGVLEVIPTENVIVQRFTSWNGDIFSRVKFDEWSSWSKLFDPETDITAALNAHTSNQQNPHSVTKSQVGLSNVDNTSDLNKPVSTAQREAIDAADKHFTHEQATASAIWTCQHNLGKIPSVSIVDTADSLVVGDVEYISLNTLKITFSAPFSGKAYMN